MTTIRTARRDDAAAIARLAGELGYPSAAEDVAARLAAIEAGDEGRVLVAEDGAGRVAGWLHVVLPAHLIDAGTAEILGLVVAAGARGEGLGARLLRAAEEWALARGAARMRVRSRVERERAHRFYEREGYARAKTQFVLDRPLGETPPR